MSNQIEIVDQLSVGGSVVELTHPLVKHHLARLRDELTPPAEFRLLIQRLAAFLSYEATKDLATRSIEVQTPLATAAGDAICERIALVPILRAGLGMVDPILNLIPQAEVWHLGIYRDEETAQPVEYYSRFPADRPADVALVLDPMLATGGSAMAALSRFATGASRPSRSYQSSPRATASWKSCRGSPPCKSTCASSTRCSTSTSTSCRG